MKIVAVHTIINCGPYAASPHWRRTRKQIHSAVRACEWPPGSGAFTIYPQSGKKRGEGNGVKPIRDGFVANLRSREWLIEGPAQNALGRNLGDFDAVLPGPEGSVVVEWETGNISSSHRSMNKLTMLVAGGRHRRGYAGGALAETLRLSRQPQLPRDRAEPRRVPCKKGVLEIVVIEHDATSDGVPKIPKGTAGRALS